MAGSTITVRHIVEADPRVVEILRSMDRRLSRIERAQGIEMQEERKIMGTIEEGFTEVETAETGVEASLATLSEDETRELADLQALKDQGDELSPENQARFDALTAAVAANKSAVDADDAAINSADPAPVVTPPADGDDGSTDSGEPAAE